jgi:hypothetical protein
MTGERPAGVVLTVAGELPAVRESVRRFFTERGWRVREPAPDRLEVERGSRRRSTFLGAFAGRHFHLSSPLELRRVPDGVEVAYRWGTGAGGVLGGVAGRARAARAHLETSLALEQHLGAGGRHVERRRV